MRIHLENDPFVKIADHGNWGGRATWPAFWIRAEEMVPPGLWVFRRQFEVSEPTTIRIHVTADERYVLSLDGELLGRGSERGDPNAWFFESYELTLEPGPHLLVAQVSAFGGLAPFAQFSVSPGLLLCADDPEWQARIGTGTSEWEVAKLEGLSFTPSGPAFGVGHKFVLDGRTWDFEVAEGHGEGWQTAVQGSAGMGRLTNDRNPDHALRPATLPPMRHQRYAGGKVRHAEIIGEGPTSPHPILAANSDPSWVERFQALHEGTPIEIPANTRLRAILDLDEYVCAYPDVQFRGGRDASVRVSWQEGLFLEPGAEHSKSNGKGPAKGNRDEIEGKFFTMIWTGQDGLGDEFISGGGESERFVTPWWQAGRFVEIVVTTKDSPLLLDAVAFMETGYPYDFTAQLESGDPRIAPIDKVGRRVLEMCSHETYMDCPYFEQLQYIGDTRLQVLVTYTLTLDDRLPRKSLEMFDASRQLSGLTQSRYPCRVLQMIPPFSMWYVGMLHDFARYRGDMAFLRDLQPGVRAVLDEYLAHVGESGLLGAVDGWNFVDWVPGWRSGMPEAAPDGESGILNLQLILALRYAADLEHWLEEPELSARWTRRADELTERVYGRFWNPDRGLFADDLAHTHFSEHAQALALLAGGWPEEDAERALYGLKHDQDLARTTIYFRHYLFEVFAKFSDTDAILERMGLWFDHAALGMRTCLESPEPTRSDCHAWGAHPIYQEFATFLGIRPQSPGFQDVEIRPSLGALGWAKGTMPTPHGDLTVEWDGTNGRVVIPSGMRATLNGATIAPGEHAI